MVRDTRNEERNREIGRRKLLDRGEDDGGGEGERQATSEEKVGMSLCKRRLSSTITSRCRRCPWAP